MSTSLLHPANSPESARPPRSRRRILLAVALLVVLLAVAGLAGLLVTQRGEALPGVELAGVDVGGLDEQELRRVVTGPVQEALRQELPVTAHDERGLVGPQQVPVRVDVEATVRQALAAGRDDGWVERVGAAFGVDEEVPPVATVDDAALDGRVRQLQAAVDQRGTPGGFTVDPATLAVRPAPSRAEVTLDVAATRELLRERLLTVDRSLLELPVEVVPPASTRAQVAAVTDAARQALATPVALAAGTTSIEVTPRELAPLLRAAPQEHGGLALDVDPEQAAALLADDAAALQREPRNARLEAPRPRPVLRDQGDATFRARPADVRLVPGAPGREVDAAEAGRRLAAAVEAGRTTAELPVTLTPPAVPTEQLQGVDQLIGSFTTPFACCQPRVQNIRRIAELLDGTVVLPGETLSVNEAVGPRTRAKGFVADGTIVDGELVDQVGGGVSQFATTLYNAAWFAGLDVLEHKPHSRYISRYPPGREATLYYGSIDLEFRNTTDAPVLLRTATRDNSVTVALYGHTGDRLVRSETGPRLPRDGGGFRVTVRRAVVDDGAVVDRDTERWTYQPPLDS